MEAGVSLIEQLARFEAQSWRVTGATAAKVRAVLGGLIVDQGGELPPGVDLSAHPAAVAKRRRHKGTRAEVTEAPSLPSPRTDSGMEETAVDRDFDFDTGGARSHTPDLAIGSSQSRPPTFDRENPRLEDLSAYELEHALERPLDEGVAIPLDDVRPPAASEPQDHYLVVRVGTEDEERLRLDPEEEVTLGRGKSCTVRLKDARASRVHCRVFHSGTAWCVEDLGSANGTTVEGEFLDARDPLEVSGGEEVVVGSTTLRFEVGEATPVA